MIKRSLYHVSLLVAVILLTLSGEISVSSSQAVQPSPGGGMAWSPNGSELAVFATNGIFIYDRNFQLLRYEDGAALFGEWSPDGTKLFVGSVILDADTLEVVFEYTEPFHAWLGNGSQVVCIGEGGRELLIRDVATGNIVKTIASPAQIELAVPSPDGTQLLVVVANGIFIFDVNAGMLIGQYILPVQSIRSYAWSVDGTQIAYSTDAYVPAGTPGSVPSPSVGNPDAVALYTVNIMDARTGAILLTSEPLPDSVLNLTWSENAPKLAGFSVPNSVYVWNTNTLELITHFALIGQSIGDMAYDPAGLILALGSSDGFQFVTPETAEMLAPIDTIIPAYSSKK